MFVALLIVIVFMGLGWWLKHGLVRDIIRRFSPHPVKNPVVIEQPLERAA